MCVLFDRGIWSAVFMSLPRSVLLTEPKSAQLGAGVVERIGNTPLLRLERVGRAYPERVFTPRRSGSIRAAR